MSLAIIPIDPAYMLVFGVLFGIAAARNPRRALFAGLVATTLFGVGVPLYCYLRYPAWMWAYAIDPATLHPWVVAWIFAIYYLCFVAGFAMTPRRYGWLLLACVGALNLALLAAVWGRYGKVGTYQEFHNGTAIAIAQSPLQMLLNVGAAVTAAGTFALWFWARRRPTEAAPGTAPRREPALAGKP